MEIILEKLKKFDTPLVWGIASAVFGICFIALPPEVLNVLLLITGILVFPATEAEKVQRLKIHLWLSSQTLLMLIQILQ